MLKQVQHDGKKASHPLAVTLNLFDKGNARATGDGYDHVSVAKLSVRVFPTGKVISILKTNL